MNKLFFGLGIAALCAAVPAQAADKLIKHGIDPTASVHRGGQLVGYCYSNRYRMSDGSEYDVTEDCSGVAPELSSIGGLSNPCLIKAWCMGAHYAKTVIGKNGHKTIVLY